MITGLKLPFGCPKCQGSADSDSFPDLSIDFEDEISDYSGTYFIKRGFVCPSCGWGDDTTIEASTSDAKSVFFTEEGKRPYYVLSECNSCRAELAYFQHECNDDDYPDEYLQEDFCRACGYSA